jgi:predicted nuclease of restriction endonuclease-like (RecB) superfamily
MDDKRSLIPEGYTEFIRDLRERVRAAQTRAGLAVNQELVLLYWSIGKDVLERRRSAKWGDGVISRIAADLRAAFPEMRGFSPRNLKYMNDFAEAWSDEAILQTVSAKLTWSHNVALLDKVKGHGERVWYAQQAIQQGWSRNILIHQIESCLFERQGKALNNFSRTLPGSQSELARQILKDPYNFDFLALGPEMLERDLERGLIENLRNLILELGKGFAFVGSQYHLEVAGQEYYLDLLFYHLRLRCFVVIDLKIEDFKPEFAGKMNFYLSAVDDLIRYQGDEPTIGIIMCKGRNEVIVEYALRDTTKPMGVTQYLLTPALPERFKNELPTSEDFAREFSLISLVGLRIEIERRVRAMAEIAMGQPERQQFVGLLPLVNALAERHIIAAGSAQRLSKLLPTLNQAAHGVEVNAEAAKAAFDDGSALLAELCAAEVK